EIDPADAAAREITPELVQRVLGCIGSIEGEGKTWVTPNGRWQHGLLRGAWAKPEAEYLGHTARENARRRRIAALQSELADIEDQIARIEREQVLVEARISKLQAERYSAPSLEPLQRVNHSLEAAEEASAAARCRFSEADQALAKARE